MSIVFYCCIPAKDRNDPKLEDLIDSIRAQDFPQDQIEIIVIDGEECGDPEQAKAMAIRRATGEICVMFCADNYVYGKFVFREIYKLLSRIDLTGAYSIHYALNPNDNSLNRYFSLIGNNDPICFYLEKCDRKPWYENLEKEVTFDVVCWPFDDAKLPSLGDNGFFVKHHLLLEHSDLDHYYPMDVYQDMNIKHKAMSFARINYSYLWHRTSDNLISFLIKRYKYARDLYCDRNDRRWRMVDTKEDKLRLCWFIISTITILPALAISIKGFLKIRDFSWFWHWPVCFGFLITYTILALRNWVKHGHLFQIRINNA